MSRRQDRVTETLERALEETEDREVTYHIRQALQHQVLRNDD